MAGSEPGSGQPPCGAEDGRPRTAAALPSMAQHHRLESLRSACGPVTVGGPGELSDPHRGCEGRRWRLDATTGPRVSHAWHVWESLGGLSFDSLSLRPLEHILMGGRWVPWHLRSQGDPQLFQTPQSVGATGLEVPPPPPLPSRGSDQHDATSPPHSPPGQWPPSPEPLSWHPF